MPKASKQTSTILIIIGIAAAVFLVKFILQGQGMLTKKIDARAKGNPSAKIQITEFLDFQCPACAKGAKVLSEVMQQNPDKMFIQLKYFPLRMHRHAYVASRYAECSARQNKFWPFHDIVFERQDDWKKLVVADPIFRNIAAEIGADMTAIDVCLQDESVNAKILEDKEEGRSLGIRSTPTYFINDKMVVGHIELEKELNSLLNL